MTKAKSSKRALLISGLALFVCITMLVGSTFAWFTDSVTSAGNKIQAGTLKIDLELLEENGSWTSIKDSQKALFDYDKWEPGYTEVKVLRVTNKGTLALKWIAKLVSANTLTDLANVIDVYVNTSATEYPAERENLDNWYNAGTLATFINTIEDTTYGNLEAGETAYLGLALRMQEEAGNEYQGMDLGGAFDIMIMATQLTAEEDSFNDQYDFDASYSAETDAFKAELAAAKAGDAVTLNLTHDAYLGTGEKLLAPEGVDVVINGNGHTIYADNAIHVIAGQRDCDITINDLTIVGKTTDDAIISQNGGVGSVNIVMNNVTVNLDAISGVPNWPVCLGGSGTATLTDCVITGAGLPSGDYADGNQFFAGALMKVTVINSKIDSVMLNNGSNGISATLNVDADSEIGVVYLEAKDPSVVTGSVENVDEMIIPVKNAGDMKQAIESASADTTVYIALARNFNATEAIAVAAGVNLVVYGEGKTVTTTGMQDKCFIRANGGTVEINDLTVTGDAKYAFYSVGGKAVMNNVKVNMDGNYKVCFYGGGVTELNNCTINGNASFVSIWFGDGRTVTINGGTYSSMCINASTGAGVGSAGTLVVNNATVDIIYGGAYEANGEVVRASITTNNSTVGKIEYEQ